MKTVEEVDLGVAQLAHCGAIFLCLGGDKKMVNLVGMGNWRWR